MTKLNKALMATTAIAFASGLALPAVAQDPTAAPGVVILRSRRFRWSAFQFSAGDIERDCGSCDDHAD